ncbi:MAG: hypothetical protein ACNYVW_01155 [Methanosarcinales archaeon]
MIRKEDPKLILAMMRSGIIRKRAVRSSGGFRSTGDIGRGLILRMRLQCNNRVHGALDLEYFETQNEAFIRKMSSENTLGMFFEWCEKEVSL